MSFQQRAKTQAAQITFTNAAVAALFLASYIPIRCVLCFSSRRRSSWPALSAFALASAALVALVAWGAAPRHDGAHITVVGRLGRLRLCRLSRPECSASPDK